MAPICLIHIVYGPLGPRPLAAFLAALRAHRAGADHELLLVFKDFDGAPGGDYEALLDGVVHRRLTLRETTFDLGAYRAAVDETAAERLCLVNSAAVPIADDWLGRLDRALDTSRAGLVGATGSWESAFSAAPATLRLKRFVEFPRFPNPHIRTNAFALDRALALELDWSGVDTKLGALRRESGRRGLSRQVRRRGLQLLVAGRDGRVYGPDEWPASHTFRSGDQENLLVADNRTIEYATAEPERRRELQRYAWGRRFNDANPPVACGRVS